MWCFGSDTLCVEYFQRRDVSWSVFRIHVLLIAFGVVVDVAPTAEEASPYGIEF